MLLGLTSQLGPRPRRSSRSAVNPFVTGQRANMETAQDIVVSSGWVWKPTIRPKDPIIISTITPRQALPELIVAPAAHNIDISHWALVSLVVGTVTVVSAPWNWEYDMHFSTIKMVLGLIVAIFAIGGFLDVKEREQRFARRKATRPSEPCVSLEISTDMDFMN